MAVVAAQCFECGTQCDSGWGWLSFELRNASQGIEQETKQPWGASAGTLQKGQAGAMASVRAGQHWTVLDHLPVDGLTMWKVPLTTGFHCTIPPGTIVVVENDPLPQATAVYCVPEDYDRLEQAVVPREDRLAAKYNGYALTIPLAAFRDKLALRDE